MARCQFEFPYTGEGASLVASIRSRVQQAGGSFDGSDSAGDFYLPTPLGAFRGRYAVTSALITIEVDEKPLIVPCNAIEAKLAEYVERTT